MTRSRKRGKKKQSQNVSVSTSWITWSEKKYKDGKVEFSQVLLFEIYLFIFVLYSVIGFFILCLFQVEGFGATRSNQPHHERSWSMTEVFPIKTSLVLLSYHACVFYVCA